MQLLALFENDTIKQLLFVLMLCLLVWWIIKPSPAKGSRSVGSEKPTSLGVGAGVYSTQGRRHHMEDTYTFEENFNGTQDHYFYGVYDGHGGARCARFCADKLHHLIKQELNTDEYTTEEAMRNAFRKLDNLWLRTAHKYDYDDGSTAVLTIVTPGALIVAHVGDSRAVLHGSVTKELTSDHKPNRPDEKARIEALGGHVLHYGTWRVEGVLAVSRAIGDRRLKRYVSAVPEIGIQDLSEDDRYLILASDGLWDVFTGVEAVQCIQGQTDMKRAAQVLGVTAMERGSLDNITVVVVDLHQLWHSSSK